MVRFPGKCQGRAASGRWSRLRGIFSFNFPWPRLGEIAAKTVVQFLFSTGKSFTVDGLREKLQEFYREEVRAENVGGGGTQ
jgi:hypothetical protein